MSEEQDVSVASRNDRKGAELIDANGKAGPFGQWHRDGGPADRQPRNVCVLDTSGNAEATTGCRCSYQSTSKTVRALAACALCRGGRKLSSGKPA